MLTATRRVPRLDAVPEERRRYPRASIELQVEYDRLNGFFADYARNICQGGTFVETDEPLDVGTEAVFVLSAPGLEQPLAIRGRVVWISGGDDPPPPEARGATAPGMGVRFLYESDQERRALEESVGRLMKDSLGELLYVKLMGRAASR
jgi:type IV pilus assembly protein PilZ